MGVAEQASDLIELDANFLIDLVQRRAPQDREVQQWITAGSLLQVSSITWSEFLCGPIDESDVQDAKLLLRSVEPFTERDAALAAELFNNTGRRPRSHADCMIAAHAIIRSARLATVNLRDFRRFEKFGLKIAT